jgi:hypothetical protein
MASAALDLYLHSYPPSSPRLGYKEIFLFSPRAYAAALLSGAGPQPTANAAACVLRPVCGLQAQSWGAILASPALSTDCQAGRKSRLHSPRDDYGHATQCWQLRTNVWRKATSPSRGPTRLRSGQIRRAHNQGKIVMGFSATIKAAFTGNNVLPTSTRSGQRGEPAASTPGYQLAGYVIPFQPRVTLLENVRFCGRRAILG